MRNRVRGSERPDKKSRLARMAAFLAFTVLGLYAAVSVSVAYTIWHPVRHPLHTTPEAYGLRYQDVSFKSAVDNIPLKGWFINSPGSRVVLVLHGSNSVRDNYIGMELSKALVEQGYDVFTFDFRGHGESGGEVGALGALETRDIAGALDYLHGRGTTEVGVLAYSMGAATALLAAPDHPEMRAIVADSSFADLFTVLERERARIFGLLPVFNPGIIAASKAMYGVDPLANEPKQAVARLGDRPLLLIHSSIDDLIPPTEAYELQKAGAGNPNMELWIARGSGHVTAFADNREEYVRRVTAFFDRHLAEEAPPEP
jgi:uncharacterized protein